MYVWESDIDSVLAVLRRFSWYEDQPQSQGKSPYETTITSTLLNCLAAGQPIPLLLSVSPWKNPNTEKVLSDHPDLGEELGLARLNLLCEELRRVYLYGAVVTLVTDGPMYNDLLGIPDEDLYDYGSELRAIAKEKGFTHIKFTRLCDIMGLGVSDSMSKAEYMDVASACRHTLEDVFLPPNFDLEQQIQEDMDTELMYLDYIEAVNEDLCWGPDIPNEVVMDPGLYAIETDRLARCMTRRSIAYETALNFRFPDHVRLSIHRPVGNAKISKPSIPQTGSFGLMPWHCCVMVTARGEYLIGYLEDFQDPERYEVVIKHGKPYCIREKPTNYAMY